MNAPLRAPGRRPLDEPEDWTAGPPRILAALILAAVAAASLPAAFISAPLREPAAPAAPAAHAERARAQDSPTPAGFLIDLNHASAAELEALPRIGPALAERIVTHRAQHGPFRSLADLDAVPGIGPRTLDALRDHVTLGREPADRSAAASPTPPAPAYSHP
ncbi:MAG: helix-hairpin-helix domain-containing protein [Planctomycetota bacterium]|nr:helix-hairpin-helix domain-containing protein [Planctomycetota bacterium]